MPEAFPTGRGDAVDQGWGASAELPDADVEEQRRAATDDDPDDVDPADLDPETVAGRTRPGQAGDQPFEANEGDVAEQALEVPLDDEFDRD